MKTPDHQNLTRREALLGTLQGALVATLALPVATEAATPPTPAAPAEFVPENDYPFFGYEPESGAPRREP